MNTGVAVAAVEPAVAEAVELAIPVAPRPLVAAQRSRAAPDTPTGWGPALGWCLTRHFPL